MLEGRPRGQRLVAGRGAESGPRRRSGSRSTTARAGRRNGGIFRSVGHPEWWMGHAV